MKDKTVLIFGQSGTFGTAMTKKLLELGVGVVIGVDRDEKNQYISKQNIGDNKVRRFIGDIRDKSRVDEVISITRPDIIMLASAMKHIDLCQSNRDECRKTNIDGCINVINSAIEHNVPKMVFLSTDKATNPTTLYGSSKDYVEKYIQAGDNLNTKIITTRYGNVLGSNGSVLDTWKKQISKGEPLTITNPEMTRFFMTIDQAVDLVLYALENGNDKDLWVYNNKACTIKELADCISDNQVETGLRCIEKNDEALLTVNELNHSDKVLDEFYIVNKNKPNRNYYKEPFRSDNAERFTKEELQKLVDGVIK